MSAALFGEESSLFGYQKIRLFIRSHARNCRNVWAVRDGFVLEAMKRSSVLIVKGVHPEHRSNSRLSPVQLTRAVQTLRYGYVPPETEVVVSKG